MSRLHRFWFHILQYSVLIAIILAFVNLSFSVEFLLPGWGGFIYVLVCLPLTLFVAILVDNCFRDYEYLSDLPEAARWQDPPDEPEDAPHDNGEA